MNTTNIRHCEACGQVRFPSDHWQRKLAAAIKQRDKAIEALNSLKRRAPSIYASKWECGK